MTTPALPPSTDAVVRVAASDRAALDALEPACTMLDTFSVKWVSGIVTLPDEGGAVASSLEGVWAVIVASPDGALPAALAAGGRVPVVRVPVGNATHQGLDLLSDENSDLPAASGETPFATVAIGEAGAKNAALLIVSILALVDARLRTEWVEFRRRQTDAVLQHPPLADF